VEFGKSKEKNHFQISSKDEFHPGTWVFGTETEDETKKWLSKIKPVAERLSNINVNDLIKSEAHVLSMMKVWGLNIVLPDNILPEHAEKWIKDMVVWKAEVNKWADFVYQVQNFAEFYNGTIKSYIDWYSGLSGVDAQMRNTEEEIIFKWREAIETQEEHINKSLDVKYFREDFEKAIDNLKRCVEYIKYYNQFKREYRRDDTGDEYINKIPIFQQFITRLEKFPKTSEVNFEGFTEGIIGGATTDGDKVAWRFKESTLKCETNEFVNHWDCSAAWQLTSAHYGVVVWNNTTWVWFLPSHTKIKIRYDWDAASSTFIWKSNPDPKAPRFTNWYYSNNIVKSVGAATKPPKCLGWKVLRGALPPPVALLVAVYQDIESTVHQLSGMSE